MGFLSGAHVLGGANSERFDAPSHLRVILSSIYHLPRAEKPRIVLALKGDSSH